MPTVNIFMGLIFTIYSIYLDIWKESIDFALSTGEIINIDIFVLILSYSRFTVYRLSLKKSQDILFSSLNDPLIFLEKFHMNY